jgi:zinc protease
VVADSPDRESESRADEYTRNFLEDEALPTIWQELAFHRRLDPGITLAEVNGLAADWFPERDRLIVVSAPENSGSALPTQAQLAGVVAAVASKRLEPYVDAIAGKKLMDTTPSRGTITKTTPRGDGSITEWVLSNGATVVIEPTTLKEGQILFRAMAPGGTSLASDEDFLSARIADTVIPAGGVGTFSSVALDKLLNGRAVAVRPFIDEIRQGMSGGSTPQDLETMFQLIYLNFTAPRADPTAFAGMKSQGLALLGNQLASPDVVFERTIDATLSQNNPRRQPESPETAKQWNLDKAFAFYKARFADASNFTFVFVGSFTPEVIRPLVETYIASLPSTGAHETWRDLKITPPTGVVKKTIEKGIAPKATVAIVFSGPFEYDDANRAALRAMVLVLQSRLSDTIRQELGGTYSITASPDMEKFPTPTYSVRIDWTCDPARTETLTERVLEEVELVRNTLLSPDRMERVRDVLFREFDRNSQDNGYLLNEIARRYNDRDPANIASVATMRAQIAALSGYALQRAAQTYLDMNRYVQVTLLPEK